jgi:hypothetical protein
VYAGKIDEHQIDPNTWQDNPLSQQYPLYSIVIVPYMDYEISRDAGRSWQVFWRYPSGSHQEATPQCSGFEKQDETHFRVWNANGAVATSDGGATWYGEQDS